MSGNATLTGDQTSDASSNDSQQPVVDEEWRSIGGYEGIYEVSNLGHVRRLTTVNGCQSSSPLVPVPNPGGHLTVVLSTHGDRRGYGIHRLVASAFLGPCPQGWCVNHKDGNKQNNHVDNLEYATIAQNTIHAERLGLIHHAVGSANGRSKLTEADVRLIRAMYASGTPVSEIVRQFQVVPTTVRRIVAGLTWKHVK